MTRKSKAPAYRIHKPSGQAVTWINGRYHYLGKHGSPESRQRFALLLAEWATGTETKGAAKPPEDVTIQGLILRFWREVEREGRYMRAGKETSERDWLRYSLRSLVEFYGDQSAKSFGPLMLRELRAHMMAARPDGKRPRRSTINGRIKRILRVFAWGVSMELIPAETLVALRTVGGLKRGESSMVTETPKRKPLTEGEIERIATELVPTLATMLRVLGLTGMRPEELCSMRTMDIDRSRDVWHYVPAKHKTERFGHERIVLIGPKAQRLLTPYLKADPSAYLFTPAQSVQERKAQRRAAAEARHQANGTAHLAPPNQARDARRAQHRKAFAPCYSPAMFRQAVQRGGERAGLKVTPYQLRHTLGHRMRREHGIEATQATLGHEHVATTENYSAPDLGAAEAAVHRIG